MSHYNTVFSQLLKLIPRHEFESLAKQAPYRSIFPNGVAMVAVRNHVDGAIVRAQ